MLLAFEPLTCAVGIKLIEHMIKRPSRVCCHAKLWLRRAPDVLVENALNEAADPVLDFLNTMMMHDYYYHFSSAAVPSNSSSSSSIFLAIVLATIGGGLMIVITSSVVVLIVSRRNFSA